ncbi:hypothetical protein POPTR_009G020000v4 [Populus trichocarpa]|uniref:Uncharacterized protein n=1 Tax=Populus trichocarpa TaxID=3694 RepID=A0ACC0SG53_POPTR|nr:hypothetical protein POPTR_009G020000v4 [Populus trichocarpa]
MEHTNNYNNRTTSDQPVGSTKRRSSFVPRLTLIVVMFFFILCLIIFIAWLVIHPLDPAIRLNSLSVSNITVSNPQFAANYDIEFTVNNTNKKVNLFVDQVEVIVNYRKGLLSSTQILGKGFEIGVLPTKQRIMEFQCMNLTVEFFSTKGTGKLMSGGKDCLVHA